MKHTTPAEQLLEDTKACVRIMRKHKSASLRLFQSSLGFGYERAAKVMDELERRGYVGFSDGATPRAIRKGPFRK